MRFSCLDLLKHEIVVNILQEHPLSYFMPDTNQKPFLCEVHCGQNVKRLLPSRLPLSLIRPLIKAIRKQMPEIWIALDVIWTRACPGEIGGTLRELGLNKHWVIWTWRIIQSQTSILGPWTSQETRDFCKYARNQEDIRTFDMFWDKIWVASRMVERRGSIWSRQDTTFKPRLVSQYLCASASCIAHSRPNIDSQPSESEKREREGVRAWCQRIMYGAMSGAWRLARQECASRCHHPHPESLWMQIQTRLAVDRVKPWLACWIF